MLWDDLEGWDGGRVWEIQEEGDIHIHIYRVDSCFGTAELT